jgi:hypothetical protein
MNRADDRFYSHALIRPLQAEVLADALANVTGVSDKYGDLPEQTRAVTLSDSLIPSPALDILGRCSRLEPCDQEAGSSAGLSRTLHLINGALINRKIAAEDNRLSKLLAERRDRAEIVEELYLLALCRMPTPKEQAFWAENISKTTSRQVLEDFLWSLLTCREFVTNH